MAVVRSAFVTLFAIGLLLPLGGVALAQETSAPAVRRDKEWHLRDALAGGPADHVFKYGRIDDTPLLCDWDGDGTATPAVGRRTATDRHEWHVRNDLSGGPAHLTFVYGRVNDVLVCGDWNGDGRETPGVVRRLESGRFEWHLRNALRGGAADITFVYGRDIHGDRDQFPVRWLTGDWNGDGRDTVGIVRHEPDDTFQWHLRNQLRAGAADIVFDYYEDAESAGDQLTDTPVVGDWNGDGRDTAGVVRKRQGSPQWLLRDEHADGPPDHSFRYGHSDFPEWRMVWHH